MRTVVQVQRLSPLASRRSAFRLRDAHDGCIQMCAGTSRAGCANKVVSGIRRGTALPARPVSHTKGRVRPPIVRIPTGPLRWERVKRLLVAGNQKLTP